VCVCVCLLKLYHPAVCVCVCGTIDALHTQTHMLLCRAAKLDAQIRAVIACVRRTVGALVQKRCALTTLARPQRVSVWVRFASLSNAFSSRSSEQDIGNSTLLEKKTKDYTLQRQFNEKPGIVLGCPDILITCTIML